MYSLLHSFPYTSLAPLFIWFLVPGAYLVSVTWLFLLSLGFLLVVPGFFYPPCFALGFFYLLVVPGLFYSSQETDHVWASLYLVDAHTSLFFVSTFIKLSIPKSNRVSFGYLSIFYLDMYTCIQHLFQSFIRPSPTPGTLSCLIWVTLTIPLLLCFTTCLLFSLNLYIISLRLIKLINIIILLHCCIHKYI